MTSSSTFSIVIAAYNRPNSLEKLLDSLNNAIYMYNNVALIISIDSNKYSDVIDLAQKFTWEHGTKSVFIHENQMGLKDHFLWCGDKTYELGPILFLEEDMMVSPYYVEYVDTFLKQFGNDEYVAGASLYSIEFNEQTSSIFIPIDDGSDTYFYQQPYWGKVYIPKHWNQFRQWYNQGLFDLELLPLNIQKWGNKSFKKYYILYLITYGKYFLFPRVSLATNLGVAGTHASNLIEYQTALLFGEKRWTMKQLSESSAVYDSFQELLPTILKKLSPDLIDYDFDVDINGTKRHIKQPYVITSKKSDNAIKKYSNNFKPSVSNVLLNIPGDEIYLTLSSNIRFNKFSMLKNRVNQMLISLNKHNIINRKKMLILFLCLMIKGRKL